MSDTDQTDLDREIARIDAGRETWEDPEPVDVKLKQPLEIVVPVRLPSDTCEDLHAIAHERGNGPSTLIRMWVLERLRAEAAAKRSA